MNLISRSLVSVVFIVPLFHSLGPLFDVGDVCHILVEFGIQPIAWFADFGSFTELFVLCVDHIPREFSQEIGSVHSFFLVSDYDQFFFFIGAAAAAALCEKDVTYKVRCFHDRKQFVTTKSVFLVSNFGVNLSTLFHGVNRCVFCVYSYFSVCGNDKFGVFVVFGL